MHLSQRAFGGISAQHHTQQSQLGFEVLRARSTPIETALDPPDAKKPL